MVQGSRSKDRAEKEKSEIQLRSGELVKEVLWKIHVVIVTVHQWRCVYCEDCALAGTEHCNKAPTGGGKDGTE